MSRIKLTKNELRDQQYRLKQLEKYLPTLQLKKAMLQAEVNQTNLEIDHLKLLLSKEEESVTEFALLLSDRNLSDLFAAVTVDRVEKGSDNIAGVEIPLFLGIEFKEASYPLFTTPLWWDRAVDMIREMRTAKERVLIAEEKCKALEKELKEVSIRVNLFEKILIPRHKEAIKKIKVFLGDQQLAAVAQAKAAKRKILEKKDSA